LRGVVAQKPNATLRMLDFLIQNSIYVVLIIVLIIWTGLFIYLYRVDKKLEELEKLMSEKERSETN
jgi:CcmD family protein